MRISDWSSDVCSSDLHVATAEARQDLVLDDLAADGVGQRAFEAIAHLDAHLALPGRADQQHAVVLALLADRKSVESGKSVSLRVDLGGRRKTQKQKIQATAII